MMNDEWKASRLIIHHSSFRIHHFINLMAASVEVTGGEYERELRAAVGLARRAGEAALAYYGGPLRVEHKEEFDEPVTQADRAVNELIVRALQETFPEDGILAEESVDTARRLSRERVWM